MKEEFPRTVDEITSTWLSNVLDATVADFSTTFLEGGVLSDAFKIHGIRYAGDARQAPTSVVVKLANRLEDRREAALAGNVYVKELSFFEELASEVPVRTPQIHALFTDGSENAEFFAIVMEDLTTHSKVFDQVNDLPNEAFMRKIALETASMHAQYWDSPTLNRPWISKGDRYVFPMDEHCRTSPENLGEFLETWARMYGEEIFDYAPGTRDLTETLCGPKCDAIHDFVYDVLSSRPKTLLHGDMRADNIFRTDPAMGKSVDDTQLTFIDWQLVGAGPPGPEFTQAWQHSIDPVLRRKDKEVLRQYHDRVLELNPAAAEYTYEMLMEDYVLGYLFWWSTIVSIGKTTVKDFDEPNQTRMKALWGCAVSRMLTAMADHNALDVVTRIAAQV